MRKIDLKKASGVYAPSAKNAEIVEVPAMDFLMIDGAGDPNGSVAFQEAVEALFSVSYTLKFQVKQGQGIDYGVMPLEGLWWVEDMRTFSLDRRDEWRYTVMIAQPNFVTPDAVHAAMANAGEKKALPALASMRFETFTEGLAAQILHIGSFADEGPTVAHLHRFIHDSGYTLHGKHHEIYLSDIRRAAPSRWKTILRQPVGKTISGTDYLIS